MSSADRTEAALRLLITGATGFVGGHLARHLLERGAAVGCIVRAGSQGSLPAGAALLRHDGSTEQLQELVCGFAPDCVVHLASYFVAEHRPQDVAPLIASNLLFATQLADATTAAGVGRLVNAGTAWQHYQDAAYDPVCLYAATKEAFDAILRYYRERSGLRVVTLELTDTYGPGDQRRKLVPLLLDRLRDRQPMAMSPGAQRISLVFISDVVAAFMRAIEIAGGLPSGEERRFGVAAAEQPSLCELVALIEREAGVALDIGWGERPYREREVMQPWQGQVLPGWHPKVDLATGIRLVLEAADVRG